VDALPEGKAPSAEDLFADYLDRVESGDGVDFAVFCRDHPRQADSLQRVHLRWQAMTRAFEAMSAEGGEPTTAPSSSLDSMREQLAKGHGRLARYKLGAEIARGAMGRIVAAVDQELRRDVALKIHRGAVDDTRLQRRFFEEAQITAQLDHPGIVPIHELGLDNEGRPFFSMQLVRGRDLGAILAAVPAQADGWTRTRVLHVLLRVCEAMAFAHSKGVVHRDLKPANVMVGQFGETYVMDWGLARVRGAAAEADADMATLRADIASEGESSALLTHYGDVLGTPAYMAPEQAAGLSHTAEPAVDVYAVGSMLYHLLAGHMPYQSASNRGDSNRGDANGADAVLQRVRGGPPERLGDDVPAELRAICEHAMARSPADRYADMGALGEDLRAFLEIRTVRAYATGRFAELRKWVARNRTLTAAVALLGLALAFGAIGVTTLWVKAERNRGLADASATRLLTELDRSAFRSARQSMQLENSSDAADNLWRAHLAGRMPRATTQALMELAERDPYLVTVPLYGDSLPVALAPRLHAVLVAGPDGKLQVREELTLALRTELGERGSQIWSIAVLGDGTTTICGTIKGEVLRFDLSSGKLLYSKKQHAGTVRNLAAVGSGGFASGGADGRVLWWPEPTAEPQEFFKLPAGITTLTAHPTGTGVAAGDEQGNLLGKAFDGSWYIGWDFKTRLSALAFDLPGKELWAGSTDHNLHVLEIARVGRSRAVPTRNGTCRQLARDVDGSFLLGGWWRIDRVSATGVAQQPVALRGVSRFAFDAERRRLLTCGVVSGLGLVDVASNDRVHLPGTSMALSADGRRLVTTAANRLEVRDVATNTVVLQLPAKVGQSPRLDDDGSLLAVELKKPSQIAVFDVATGSQKFLTEGPTDTPFGDASAFSADGEELVTRPEDSRLRRVRTSDGTVIAEYPLPDARLIRAVYSHDGRWLAAIGRATPIVHLFDLQTGVRRDLEFNIPTPGGAPATLSAVALSADGSRIAVGTWQGMVMVRFADGHFTTIPAHPGTIWSVQFTAVDDGLLYTSGGSQGIACWDLDSNECCYQALQDVVKQMQISADGSTMACLTTEGVVLFDRTYRERHVAGNLGFHLERARGKVELPPGREAALQAWAAEVLARPWPRWQR
jgi:serine/threonine protein kinase/WD40 repeat protein